MGNYIPIDKNDKRIIINYMRDRREDPKYQLCPRQMFKEITWCHWIQDEIIFAMKANDPRTAIQILNDMAFEMADCVALSKSRRSKELFNTAYTEIENCQDLLIAKNEEG